MFRKYPYLPVLLAISLAVGAEPFDAESAGVQRIPDVLFIPTPPDVVDAMLQLAEVSKDDMVFDLGCGDGRILIAAASRFSCHAVGYDIDPLRVDAARDNASRSGVEHLVRIEQRDLFDVDLKKATVVTLYLSPGYNRRLIPQFRRMQSGSRIVSHQFSIRGLEPDKIVQVESRHDHRVHVLYLWTAPFSFLEAPRRSVLGSDSDASKKASLGTRSSYPIALHHRGKRRAAPAFARETNSDPNTRADDGPGPAAR